MNNQQELKKLLVDGRRFYAVCTGGGAGLLKTLWEVPGISSVLVGAEFPYAQEATDRFLGFKPAKYCSEDTAILLALEAYSRAFVLNGPQAIGIGLTASVASTVAHRGDHRVFIARAEKTGVRLFCETLPKGVGSVARISDGQKCDDRALLTLLYPDEIGMTDATERAMTLFLEHPLFLGNGQRLALPNAQREALPANGEGLVLFPGAFNPPHEGHKWLAKTHRAVFHITTNPPHKPALNVIELVERAKLLEGFDRMFTQDDPLYLDKARRFPGATFIVGVDAMDRMLDPKWGVAVQPLLAEFRALGTKFLVADREVNGALETLWDIKGLTKELLLMAERIEQPANLVGLSSTVLRSGADRTGT